VTGSLATNQTKIEDAVF